MRISTASRYDTTIANLQQRQSDLSRVGIQMSSGKRVNQASDDPTAAARADRAYNQQQRIASQQRSMETSRGTMQLAESALGQAGELLQSARETIVAAGDTTFGGPERTALARQLQSVRDQLLALANQGDGVTGYTFGGQGATHAPFQNAVGAVGYSGGPGQAQLSQVEDMPTTVDGENVWLRARSGNGVFVTASDAANTGQAWIDAGEVAQPAALADATYEIVFTDIGGGAFTYDVLADGQPTAQAGVPYESGKAINIDGMAMRITGAPADGDRFTTRPAQPELSPFQALDRAIAVLGDPNASRGQVSQAVSNGLRDVDAASAHLQGARAQAGAALNRLDGIDTRNQDRALWAKSVQSGAEDLDMIAAVSKFQNQQTGYQAALQSYGMVQRLSLFDYIK